jgi:hypothetical protein
MDRICGKVEYDIQTIQSEIILVVQNCNRIMNMDIKILNKYFDIYLTLDIRWREIHKVGGCVITTAISTAHQTCQNAAYCSEHIGTMHQVVDTPYFMAQH